MNGRITPLALDAYNTDGQQGIYCPETSASKNSRTATNDTRIPVRPAGTADPCNTRRPSSPDSPMAWV